MRQAVRPRPGFIRGNADASSIARSGVRTRREPGGVAGTAPTPGAACRALTGGSPPGAAPPPGQHARTRRPPVPAATHPMTATARTGQAVLLAPGIPLTASFPGKIGTYHEDGGRTWQMGLPGASSPSRS